MIVGRDVELARLAGALDDAEAGRARSLLLVGDAGMGKSALLRAVEDMALARGFQVARTGSPEGSEQLRYAVIEDLAACLPEARRQLGGDDALVLAGLSSSGSAGPSRVATAVLHLLQAAQESGPLLIAVDDVHWADEDSRAAMTLAVGRMGTQRVALVGAARPRPATDARVRSLERIDVGPLDPAPAEALLRERLPRATESLLTPLRAAQLVDQLGCHPLALVECSRLLTGDQILGVAPVPDPLPLGDRLMDAWGGALSGLDARARTAALVLCVTRHAGSRLTGHVLAGCGLCEDDLQAAADARLVTAPPGASSEVVHPLICAAIRAVAGVDSVREMHHRAADAAVDLGLGPATVVAHLAAAAEPGDRVLIDRLAEQARAALASRQPTTAANALFAAARLSTSAAERGRLAAQAARTLLGASRNVTDAGPLVAFLAEATLSPEDRVWAEWLRAEHLAEQDLRLSLPVLMGAARLARQADSPALAAILWSAIHLAWAVQDARSALAAAEAYAALPVEARHPMPPWAGHAMLGLSRFQAGDVAGAEDSLARARRMSDDWHLAPDTDLAMLLAVVPLDEALGMRRPFSDPRLNEALRRSMGDHGETLGFLRNIQANRALRGGDVLVARELVTEGLALSRAVRFRQNVILRLCTLVRIDAITGDADSLQQDSQELRALSRQLGHTWAAAFADRAEGLLALGEGRLDDALRHLEPLAADRTLGLGADHPVLRGRADLIDALVRSGEADRAASLGGALVELLTPSSDPAARALVAEVRGLIGQGADAVTHLTESVRLHREAGEVFETARAHLLLGELLRRERRATCARHELRMAAAEFERIGAVPWQARAVAELRAAGTASPVTVPDVWAALTAQERRVAEAVAQGASNREAAAALFLSPRTVEHHLASAYRKLGVTSRTALAHSLREQADRR